jgi:hypothetical protein
MNWKLIYFVVAQWKSFIFESFYIITLLCCSLVVVVVVEIDIFNLYDTQTYFILFKYQWNKNK